MVRSLAVDGVCLSLSWIMWLRKAGKAKNGRWSADVWEMVVCRRGSRREFDGGVLPVMYD
jgi:hypothetical protein